MFPDFFWIEAIWENLSRRFGHIDEAEGAKRRFDSKRQLESETIKVFEQGIRSIFWEAWPTADIKAKLEYLALYGRTSMAAFRQLSTHIVPPCSNVLDAQLNTHGQKFGPESMSLLN